MTKLETLYDEAFESDIEIINARFSKTKKAACLYDDDYKAIVLDKPRIKSETEELILLAEEIGHYETSSFYLVECNYNKALAKLNREKGEAKARRWAIRKIIPPEEIQRAIDNCCSDDYEIAEYCDVPVHYLREAIRIYQSQGVTFRFPDCEEW